VVAQKVASEPGFSWWVLYTLKKSERIVAAVNKHYLLWLHNFDVEIPKSVQDALRIDEQTNTTYLKDAIELEIQNIDDAFKELK
jgi:hypothetical protein